MTHEQLMDALPENTFDRASIWRVLADLAECGILRRMDLGDRVWRYELHDECRVVSHDHAHFLCEQCGIVHCLPPVELRSPDGQIPSVLQGAVFRLRIMGDCADCVSDRA